MIAAPLAIGGIEWWVGSLAWIFTSPKSTTFFVSWVVNSGTTSPSSPSRTRIAPTITIGFIVPPSSPPAVLHFRPFAGLDSFDPRRERATPSSAAITIGPAPRLLVVEPTRKPIAPAINAAAAEWFSIMRSGRRSSSVRPTLALTSLKASRRSWRASSRSSWILEICSSVVISSIVMSLVAMSSARFCVPRPPPVGVWCDEADDEIGRRAAQRHLAGHRERRKPDFAVRSSTEDESSRTGYGQRSQRFFPDVLADVALAAATLLLLPG